MVRAWLRLSLLGAFVASSAPALGGPNDAEDDEKPGAPRTNKHADEPMAPADESVAPRTDKAAVPAATKAAPANTVETGDSAVRLDNSGVAREGVYNGVTIGGQNLPPKAPKLPLKGGPQRMTWPGFQVRDGVPTVFLQTTGAPDYAVSETKGTIVVTLRHTTIKLRNNQRPLKVAEFGTDVTEVSAKPKGKDVVVTIRRKHGDGTHREHVEPSAGGFSLLLVELPSK
jgi:hypothetical protein